MIIWSPCNPCIFVILWYLTSIKKKNLGIKLFFILLLRNIISHRSVQSKLMTTGISKLTSVLYFSPLLIVQHKRRRNNLSSSSFCGYKKFITLCIFLPWSNSIGSFCIIPCHLDFQVHNKYFSSSYLQSTLNTILKNSSWTTKETIQLLHCLDK